MEDGFGLAPLPGGHSGETFLAEAAGERTVVRVYAGRGAGRGPQAPEVDAAVLRLVRGLLPVPEVLEVRRPDPERGTPGLLVTSFLPGTRLDELLPRLDESGVVAVGEQLGRALARLAHVAMLRAGEFADAELRIEPFGDADADRARWPGEAPRGSGERAVLVHGDFCAANLLVDPATLELTAVVDWERACAGSPLVDLANLVGLHPAPAFATAVVDAYLGTAGGLDGLATSREVARAVGAEFLTE